MRDIPFVKMQGAGNDFVIIDGIQYPDIVRAGRDLPLLARRICDRHFGIGADGLILALPSEKADYRMRIINSDGSEAEMCGNGIRCFARYTWENKIGADGPEGAGSRDSTELAEVLPVPDPPVAALERSDIISVETLAGIIIPAIIEDDGKFIGVEVDMGVPKEEALNETLKVEGASYKINKISMGNPHCVIFVDDLKAVDLAQIGPVIENLPQFPDRTNVEFARVISRSEMDLKVWERGAGQTLACGTGACAAVAAAILNGLADRKVAVHLPGGDLEIEWEQDKHIIMRGPAEKVFEGVLRSVS